MIKTTLILVLLSLLVLTGCQSPLRLNEIQMIGSHNSYKQAIDPALLKVIAASDQQLAMSLDYSHLTLPTQLERGIRKFELDVFYDPEGGRYRAPAGLVSIPNPTPYETAALQLPGFKVMHVQDIDFRSHCPRLRGCLQQLSNWSDRNPEHLPIFITLNAKDADLGIKGFTRPLPFASAAWTALDAALREGLGDKLYTPDEFRGGRKDLPEAVKAGWPTLAQMRGRVIVVLDHRGAKLASYLEDHGGLQGRAMFVNAPAGTPETAILIVNDPVKDFDEIQQLVRAGYIVRTRSDADTVEARTGDVARRERAFDSGAQIISTDYYQPNPVFKTGFRVNFPGDTFVRCNPVLKPDCKLEN